MINRIEIIDTDYGVAIEFYRGEKIAWNGTLPEDTGGRTGDATLSDLLSNALAGVLARLAGKHALEVSVNGYRLRHSEHGG